MTDDVLLSIKDILSDQMTTTQDIQDLLCQNLETSQYIAGQLHFIIVIMSLVLITYIFYSLLKKFM